MTAVMVPSKSYHNVTAWYGLNPTQIQTKYLTTSWSSNIEFLYPKTIAKKVNALIEIV